MPHGFDSTSRPENTNSEEHGAAGDVSTGRRLKYVQNVPLASRYDHVSDTLTYVGYAKPGTADSSALWRIKKLDSTYGSTFADGDDLFNNVWDNHTSLSYS